MINGRKDSAFPLEASQIPLYELIGATDKGALQGDRLGRVAGDGNPDQIRPADDSVGRIELDPSGAGQVNLNPGVGCARIVSRRP